MDDRPGKKERRRQEEAARRQATPGRARLEKAAVNALLVTLLTLFAIDALPASTRLHAWLQDATDPLLDATGLWQGGWNLFAPEPDMANTALSAEITYDDGSVHRWRSPGWRGRGVLERARLFRHMEYWDGVALDRNRAAWEPLARWLARTEARRANGARLVERVALTRHATRVAPPPAGLGLLDPVELRYLPEQRQLFHESWGPR